MKIYLPDLKKEVGKFVPYSSDLVLVSPGSELSKDESVTIRINLKAAYVPHRVLIEGKWETKVKVSCNRCLDNFTLSLGGEVNDKFEHLKGIKEQGEDLSLVDEMGEDFFKGDVLELQEYFRQLFLVSQPLKILCKDNCQGLCPVCGINKNNEKCDCVEENVDPRWSVLKRLVEKQ